ncbi:S-adenosyl-L-methionine-dependent methyltransferase [Echria macrotheca]|uniref:S-adenosyl-L-methionine-dependent methyltransferase n=1 Tax=Echria macrotheca TaxID=438768 RepID=A0AAJ0BEC0_9PEZI|nr:S-adenosyl-L-methionine-dependent methyltransferase [Echria macrotheca]
MSSTAFGAGTGGGAIAARPDEEHETDYQDSDSATASLSSSILEYRAMHGRTYHSARHTTDYFTPNDGQQQQSVDLTHHYLTLFLDGKLFVAPLPEKMERILDVGTGTGIWAIDFADEYPDVEVVGTDLSPMQPTWIPPNMKFEIDDAALAWTYPEGHFDFVHIRYLFGAISDWLGLFKQAFRSLKPGGWIQDCEMDTTFYSDDGTLDGASAMLKWNQLYRESGAKTGASFNTIADNKQRQYLEEAGFVDVQIKTFKIPVGGWALDKKLAEVGGIAQMVLLNDIEGYTLALWHNVLMWPEDEYRPFLDQLRKALQNKKIHSYLLLRYAYGRKPESA